MLLATGPSFEFLKLIQILCWISSANCALVAFLITVFLHYRQAGEKPASQQQLRKRSL